MLQIVATLSQILGYLRTSELQTSRRLTVNKVGQSLPNKQRRTSIGGVEGVVHGRQVISLKYTTTAHWWYCSLVSVTHQPNKATTPRRALSTRHRFSEEAYGPIIWSPGRLE